MKLRTFSTLQIALGISLSVHAALLTLRLADPEAFNRVFQDTPLEVILVNTRTNERPDQARAIAQASMAGGGDHDRGRASSPLPSALISIDGDGGDQELQQLRELQERQSLMLTQVKTALAAMPQPEPRQAQISPEQAQRLQMDAAEPCLLLTRRTWTQGVPVTLVRCLHPASRYRLGSRYSASGNPIST